MIVLLIAIFVFGYIFIILEHRVEVDKAASALLTGVLCWVVLLLGRDTLLIDSLAHIEDKIHFLHHTLVSSVGEISEILFFLLAAMTIVELIDAHHGFRVITDKITTTSRLKLLWLICCITFFFSAALDNLTTAIVMATLIKKIIGNEKEQWFFGGMVIIAANAGGAWSPIGDITTIMLWIGGQITALNIIQAVFIPSVVCLLVPLIILSFILKGDVDPPKFSEAEKEHIIEVSNFDQRLIFWLAFGGLLFVPVFKNVFHLPPFMGILFSLGILWVVTGFLHRNKKKDIRSTLSISGVIQRVDTPSILFFLGILLAVSSLQTAGILNQLAVILDDTFASIYVINTLIGLLSSIVDNVPLVAGAMGMYSLETYQQDHPFWEILAYCAGTGGSVLIIGSAAGVAIMGILKIDFIWYFKRIAWLALIGYFAGVLVLYMLR